MDTEGGGKEKNITSQISVEPGVFYSLLKSQFASQPRKRHSGSYVGSFQYDSVKKKEKGKVPDSLEAELTAAYAQETEAAKRLTEGKDNHKHFKVPFHLLTQQTLFSGLKNTFNELICNRVVFDVIK